MQGKFYLNMKHTTFSMYFFRANDKAGYNSHLNALNAFVLFSVNRYNVET